MKKILSFLLSLVFTLTSFAQRSQVFVDSVDSKSTIFSKSLMWVTNTWKNANYVIQLKDEQSGTIIIKGGISSIPTGAFNVPAKGMTQAQLTIRVKDGKSKLEFENITFVWDIGIIWTLDTKVSSGKNQYNRWHDSVLKEIEDIFLSYGNYISKKLDDF